MKRWLLVASAIAIVYLFDKWMPYYVHIEF